MVKKVLASIGIGNASVDTVVPSETVTPGETVDADVNVSGGEVEQAVGTIRFEIETRYRTDDGYRTVDLARFTLAEGLTIAPDAEATRSVRFEVPSHTPVTLGRCEVWLETELDIDLAVDPEDVDHIDVRPPPRLQAAFDAMDGLGFSFRDADCEADPYGRYATGHGFVQEFEFRPTDGRFRGQVDEVDLVAVPGADALELFVEVDRRGGLLSEVAETDERTTRTTVRSTDADAVREELATLIERHA
jgi:sporulation-control protein